MIHSVFPDEETPLTQIPKLCDGCRVERARGTAVPLRTRNERAAESAFHLNPPVIGILLPFSESLASLRKIIN